MSDNLWEYVKVLGALVSIVFLLCILFEIIKSFILNRRKDSLQEEMMEDLKETYKTEITKKISEVIDNSFKNINN